MKSLHNEEPRKVVIHYHKTAPCQYGEGGCFLKQTKT